MNHKLISDKYLKTDKMEGFDFYKSHSIPMKYLLMKMLIEYQVLLYNPYEMRSRRVLRLLKLCS